jgi:hypothetical protein
MSAAPHALWTLPFSLPKEGSKGMWNAEEAWKAVVLHALTCIAALSVC